MPRRHVSAPPDRPMTRNLAPLLRLLRFVRPYLGHVALAAVALLVAAGAVLAFGQVIREVVDHGLKTGSEEALTRSLLLFLAWSQPWPGPSWRDRICSAGSGSG